VKTRQRSLPRAERGGSRAAAGQLGDSSTRTWEQPVVLTSAVKGDGLPELEAALDRHHDWLIASGELQRRRRQRLRERTREVVDRATRRWLWEETRADQVIESRLDDVAAGQLSPYELAHDVLEELKQGETI
jgi:LAO/AO transport system kinase